MAKKAKSQFVCQNCGASVPRWQGQCSECQAWNTLVEETQETNTKRGWAPTRESDLPTVLKLSTPIEAQKVSRLSTGFSELDRVLGGGLLPGSFTLLGGDPGIGKSTLLMQMAGGLAKSKSRVLYVTAEESVEQTALRAQRLGVKEESIELAAESALEKILTLAETRKPHVLVVDSIQTVYLNEIQSAPGTVSQVRESAARLLQLAKIHGVSVLIIGHVTKDGGLAGPKVLEHMVDTVLSFEGDSTHNFRLLRAQKNRFGATNELGVFQMSGKGLLEVTNPSEFFLEERSQSLIGSVVFATMEGTRPFLCEVQALTHYSPMPMPRRTSIGFDANRVHLLIAVLDKFLNLDLQKQDVFINVVGGLKLQDPAADLAVMAALVSAARGREIHSQSVFLGEVGLTGEIRAIPFCEDRIREARKLGFTQFFVPASNQKHLNINAEELKKEPKATLRYLRSIQDFAGILSGSKKTEFVGPDLPNF